MQLHQKVGGRKIFAVKTKFILTKSAFIVSTVFMNESFV